MLGQLRSGPSHIVMVDVDHAELRLQLHSFREHRHQLVEGLFCVLHLGIVDEDNSVRVLLDGGPALLVLEIPACVPELDVDFAEVCNTWGWVSLKVNDSEDLL